MYRQFNDKKDKDELLIPENFFQETVKKCVRIDLPYCQRNEEVSKKFVEKFKDFTDDNFDVFIVWKTKKVRNLFRLKCNNPHPVCKVYMGKCSCGQTYIGETVRNVEVRWKEHNSGTGNSEPSKHLQENDQHDFTWKVLMTAPLNTRERKNLEASLIAIHKPSLNNQLDAKILCLFRNGIT